MTVISGSIYTCFFRQMKLERSRKKLFGSCKSPMLCLGVLETNLELKRRCLRRRELGDPAPQ